MSYISVMGLQMSIYIYKLQKLMWLIIKIWKFSPTGILAMGTSRRSKPFDRWKKKGKTKKADYKPILRLCFSKEPQNNLLIISVLWRTLVCRSSRQSLRPTLAVPVITHWTKCSFSHCFLWKRSCSPLQKLFQNKHRSGFSAWFLPHPRGQAHSPAFPQALFFNAESRPDACFLHVNSKEGQQISRENGKTVPVEITQPRQHVLSGVGEVEGTETIADNPRNVTFQPPLVGGYGVGQQHGTENVVLPPEQHICSICMNSQLSERSRRRQAPDCPVSAK